MHNHDCGCGHDHGHGDHSHGHDHEHDHNPEAVVASVIEKPIAEVFAAIVDPAHLRHFFVHKSSAPLRVGESVTWSFDDAGADVQLVTRVLQEDEEITFGWLVTGTLTEVTIGLTPVGEGATEVAIRERGWELSGDGLAAALQQTSCWTDFLCCLKAYLLFHVDLRQGKKL